MVEGVGVGLGDRAGERVVAGVAEGETVVVAVALGCTQTLSDVAVAAVPMTKLSPAQSVTSQQDAALLLLLKEVPRTQGEQTAFEPAAVWLPTTAGVEI